MMSVSNATITVAPDGPKNKTAANTNASETEMRALMDGSFTLNEPVRNVSPARYSHSIAWWMQHQVERGRGNNIGADGDDCCDVKPRTKR